MKYSKKLSAWFLRLNFPLKGYEKGVYVFGKLPCEIIPKGHLDYSCNFFNYFEKSKKKGGGERETEPP